MKKWTIRILLCLLLGVLTTYLVAWSFAIIPPRGLPVGQAYSKFIDADAQPLVHRWQVSARDTWRQIPGFGVRLPFNAGYTRDSLVDGLYNDPQSHMQRREVIYHTAGWPLHAVEGWSLSDFDADLAARTEDSFGLMPLDVSRFIERANTDRLPLRPMWPGFLINTLLASLFWFTLLFGSVTMRDTNRALRRSRGKCPLCAYDLQKNFADGCPECGWGR